MSESKRVTVEMHGDGWAIYVGRDGQHHGFNIATITEVDPHFSPVLTTILEKFDKFLEQENAKTLDNP